MRISHVGIKNFRSLKDVAIDFDAVTTFIGPNGVGKSNVLHALNWFFNGGKNGELTEKDCSFGAADEPVEVEVTFTGLTDADREALGKYVVDGVDSFTAWKRREPSGEETLSANAKGFHAFTEIKNTAGAMAKKELYKSLREARPELGLPTANTGPAVDTAMTAWEAEHVDQLEDVPEVQTNFFGFNSNGKMSGLFDFVLVTADMRASEESQDAKASIIGRILERSIDRTAADEEIAVVVENSRAEQQRIYRERFSNPLKAMAERLNGVVDSYAPGRSVSVDPAEIELRAPRTTFNLTIHDGETDTAIERQGHGFQRTLLISALQMLAESGAEATEGVICLAIEEPELFQHPTQAQAFAKVLRSLADDSGKRIQVTYATHSPYFIEARHFDQVRRLTRSSTGDPAATVHSTTVTEVKAKLAGTIRPDSVDSQLDGTISNQLSVALFANRALLVEGTTESAVLYGVGDRSEVGALEARGVAIIPVSGKMNIPLAHAILSEIGIPVFALFDGDSGFEARAIARAKKADKIADERKTHVAANRTILKYFGLPEVDFPTQQIADNVAAFEDHLEAFIDANWPEWDAARTALEAATGVLLDKSQDAYRTTTLKAGGTPPQFLVDVLAKVEAI